MKNRTQVLKLIDALKAANMAWPDPNCKPDYYTGYSEGKADAIQAIIKEIETIVRNEEREF